MLIFVTSIFLGQKILDRKTFDHILLVMRNFYEGVGFFQSQWVNPLSPFNPLFDPKANARFAVVQHGG